MPALIREYPGPGVWPDDRADAVVRGGITVKPHVHFRMSDLPPIDDTPPNDPHPEGPQPPSPEQMHIYPHRRWTIVGTHPDFLWSFALPSGW